MAEGLIFDMDGLIFNSERVVQRSWNDVGKLLGIEAMGNHIYQTIGFNRERRTRYFRETIGEDFPDEEFSRLTRERFYEIVEKEGLELKTGARELIRFAKERGYRMGVATSSREDYAVKLFQEAGIYHCFDGFIFGNMVEHSKPDPEIYLKACQKVGLPPDGCIAFEDAPAGVRSAHRAGLTVVMVPDLVQPDEEMRRIADYVCPSLLDVIPLLENEEM